MGSSRFTLVLAADHQAVAAFKSPDAPAGTNIKVVDAMRLQFLGASNIVVKIRVSAVDYNIVGREKWNKLT
jgi:hypothetical protein